MERIDYREEAVPANDDMICKIIDKLYDPHPLKFGMLLCFMITILGLKITPEWPEYSSSRLRFSVLRLISNFAEKVIPALTK